MATGGGGTTASGGASGGTTSGGAASGGAGSGGDASGGITGDGGGGLGGASGGAGGATSQDCNTGTLTTRLPCLLSATGLYTSDMQTLADGVHPYAPQFKLWSDGADKKRWIWLPPSTQIDTTDMDYWSFPVGTKIWKEFTRDNVRVETRLIEKQPSGTWYVVAYLWRPDQMEADAVPDGMMNASGTEHDVPNSDQCWTCHSQQPDKALGFSAIQLAHDPVDANDPNELTLDRLVSSNLLSQAPSAAITFSSGWPQADRDLFGYMHANCGTCHNPMGSANQITGLDLWLKIADLGGTSADSTVYKGIVGVDIMKKDVLDVTATKRVDPGSLDNSAIYQRFITKGQVWSMPNLGTELVDPDGKKMIEDFILALP